MRPRKNENQKGSALIELALCLSLFWLPLFIGTYQVGFELVRAVQMTQICRDAAHMYSMGRDFAQTQDQQLLTALMPSTIDTNSNAVFYFTAVTIVDAKLCQDNGLQPTASGCPNLNQAVIIQQVPFGNKSVGASAFGTPNCPASADYSCDATFYLKSPNAVAKGFMAVLPLQSNATTQRQTAMVGELFVNSADLGYFQVLGDPTEYARSIF